MIFDFSTVNTLLEPIVAWTGWVPTIPGGNPPGTGNIEGSSYIKGSTSSASQAITGAVGVER